LINFAAVEYEADFYNKNPHIPRGVFPTKALKQVNNDSDILKRKAEFQKKYHDDLAKQIQLKNVIEEQEEKNFEEDDEEYDYYMRQNSKYAKASDITNQTPRKGYARRNVFELDPDEKKKKYEEQKSYMQALAQQQQEKLYMEQQEEERRRLEDVSSCICWKILLTAILF